MELQTGMVRTITATHSVRDYLNKSKKMTRINNMSPGLKRSPSYHARMKRYSSILL